MPSIACNLFQTDAEFRLRLFGAIVAGVFSLVISQLVFRGAYVTADEGSYVFQANCFRDGVIARPLPPIYPAFKYRMIILKNDFNWMSRYSPGHGLWLLPGVSLDTPRLMSALAAGLSVWFLTGCARFISIRPGIVLLLLLCSPYFLFMYGTLLSHTSAHLCLVIALWAYLAWLAKRQWRYAFFCGVSFGFMFLIRNYTAMLIGLPLAIHALADGLTNRNRVVWTGLITVVFCALIAVALQLLYNYLAVGNALQSTYLVYNPGEALGFGWRNMFGVKGYYTWELGLKHMVKSLSLLDWWAWGFYGSLVAVAILLVIGWTWPWSLIMAGSAISVWLGYVFFSSHTIDNIGPYYYFETLPCLVLIAAMGIQRVGSMLRLLAPSLRRVVITSFALFYISVLAAFLWSEGRVLRSELAYEGRYKKMLENAPPQSLIFLRGISSQYHEPADNPRGLLSQPLVVWDMSDAVSLAIAKCFPARTPYVMKKGAEETLVPFDRNRSLDIFIPAGQCRGYTGKIEILDGSERIRIAHEGRDEAHWMACHDYAWICPGRFKVSYEIAYSNVAPDKPVTLDVVVVTNDSVLAETKVFGSQSAAVHAIEFTAHSSVFLEPRVHYNGSGHVFLRSIRIQEQQ